MPKKMKRKKRKDEENRLRQRGWGSVNATGVRRYAPVFEEVGGCKKKQLINTTPSEIHSL